MRVISTFGDTRPARDQTLLNLWKRLGRGVEAVHAAPGTLEVHYVELFVQKCVEFIRSCFHACGCTFKHLFIHIFDLTFSFRDFKEFSQLLMCCLIGIKVHLSLFLKLLVRLVFLLSPSELSLGFLLVGTLEESWFAGVEPSIMSLLISLELLLGLFTLALLLLENVEVAEICRLARLTSLIYLTLHSGISL